MRVAASALQCIATEASMSYSRAPSRGWNQWRRRFSDRPNGGRDAFVSGDSHFRSVSEANSAFRPGDGRGNYGGFPRPPFRPPPQFRHPRPARPPQSKPPDFRNWEYAITQPPSHYERFIVLSYNILADYLAFKHRHELYYHIPRHILDWEWRKRKIVFELGLWSPDIMCFQEVDKFQDLEDELQYHGYSGIWKRRTGIPVDGCATFWRTARFKLLHEECIEFNKFGLRDNVAQICVLESRDQNHAADGSGIFPSSSNEGNRVVVCNIHVLYNPKRGEIKLGQVRLLLEKAYGVSTLWNDAPVVLCGDFNCTPKSPMYNFISEQKLNLSGLARDQISGQSSGQLYAPEQYGRSPGHHTNRNRSPDNPDGASLLNAEKNIDVVHDKPEKIGNMPSTSNFTQSDSMLHDMSNKLSSDVHSECENIKSGATTEDEVADVNGIELSSRLYIPIESPSSSQNEGMIPIDSKSGLSNGYIGQSYHRTCTSDSSSNIDQSSQVVVTEEKESSHFCLEKENSNREVRISFSGNEARFDDAANASNSETSPALESDAFVHEKFKASPPIHFENISFVSAVNEDNRISSTSANGAYQIGASNASASFDLDVNKKLADLSLVDDDDDDAKYRIESIGEDLDKCAALSHELQPTPPSDEVQIEEIFSPSIDYGFASAEKNSYDPYMWTPMEIQTASGNAECTTIEHPLKLRSTYAEVEDYSGTRDESKEPLVTSYNRRFMGTVDYIWCSDGLQTVKVLDTIPKQAMQWTPGFPTPKWGSDHIALASQLAFTKNGNHA